MEMMQDVSIERRGEMRQRKQDTCFQGSGWLFTSGAKKKKCAKTRTIFVEDSFDDLRLNNGLAVGCVVQFWKRQILGRSLARNEWKNDH